MTQKGDVLAYVASLQENAYERIGVSAADIEKESAAALGEETRVPDDINRLANPSAPPGQITASEVNAFKEEIRGLELPTPFEEPFRYHLILNTLNEIEEAAAGFRATEDSKEVGFEEYLGLKMTRPSIFTLPTGRLYPATVTAPSNDRVVFIESEFFNFVFLLSKVMASTLPTTKGKGGMLGFSSKPKAILKRLKRKKKIVQRFADLVLAYTVAGSPLGAEPYYPEAPYDDLAEVLRASVKAFVLGHEYYHTSSNPKIGEPDVFVEVQTSLAGQTVKEVAWTVFEETTADLTSTILLDAVMQRRLQPLSIRFLGADLFHGAVSVIDRALYVLALGSEELYWRDRKKEGAKVSAPPGMFRIAAIRESLKSRYGPGILNPAEAMEFAMETLWERTRPMVYRQFAEGARAHPRWLGGDEAPRNSR